MVNDIPESYKEPPRVTIRQGNNSRLIKTIMIKRWWWVIEDDSLKSNFLWSQSKDLHVFNTKTESMRIHNHF